VQPHLEAQRNGQDQQEQGRPIGGQMAPQVLEQGRNGRGLGTLCHDIAGDSTFSPGGLLGIIQLDQSPLMGLAQLIH
jgi:hypothetical protein